MSAGLRIEIKGSAEVMAAFNRKPAALRRAIGLGLRDGNRVVLRRATENLRGKVLKVDTGRLWRLMEVYDVEAGTAAVGTNVEYAAIHEFGGRTKPHVIRARHAGALAFPKTALGSTLLVRNRKGQVRKSAYNRGLIVLTQEVHHPGSVMPARPYLRPALRESVPDIREAIEKRIGDMLKGES